MNERGQVTVMVAGLALVSFAVAGFTIDATRAFLFRRTLQNAADSSALAGASELDVGAFRAGGRAVLLAEQAGEDVARSFVERRGLPVSARVDVDADTVQVLLRGEMPTTLLGLVGIEAIAVTAVAEAAPLEGSP
jgi:Flp pilus assembly protein TadG